MNVIKNKIFNNTLLAGMFMVLFLCMPSFASATTYYHDGIGTLNDSASWWDDSAFSGNNNNTPTSGDIGMVQSGITVSDTNSLINFELIVDSGGVVITSDTLTVTGSLTVNGLLTVSAGNTLNIGSVATVTVGIGGTLNIQSGGILNIGTGGTLDINGTLNVNSGGTLTATNGSFLNINSGGVLYVVNILNIDNGANFALNNSGTLQLTATATFNYGNTNFTFGGNLTTYIPNITIAETGVWTVDAGGMLNLYGQLTINSASSQLAVSGVLNIQDTGILYLNAGLLTTYSSATIEMSCDGVFGILTGATFNNGGTFDYTSGFENSGTFNDTGTSSDISSSCPPPAPGAPDLQSGYDTGRSQTDNITNSTTLIFDMSCIDGNIVELHAPQGTVRDTSTCDGNGNVSLSPSTLSPGTYTFYARQDNGNLSAYSGGLTVTIDTTLPTISSIVATTTATTSRITWTTNESATSSLQYGLTTGYGTASSSATVTTSHTINLSGLTASTTYNFKISVSDAAGNLASSTNQTFTTLSVPAVLHTVTTGIATSTTASTTILHGAITATGTQTVTTRGFQYATNSGFSGAQTVFSSSAGYATGTYSLPVTGLTCNTTYYYAAYASSASYVVGSTQTFTTGACPITLSAPTVTAQSASSITTTSAVLNGSITGEGNASSTVRGFTYGLTTSYGSTTSVGGSLGITSFYDTVTDLVCNTTYHYSAYATNSEGTGTSTDATFTTSACPVVSTPSSGGGGGGGSSSGGSSSSYTAPTSVNTSTTTPSTTASTTYTVQNPITVPLTKNNLCTPYILPSVSIALGKNNIPLYVQKLQTFLNTYEGTNLVVDGIFKKADMEAVRAFQTKYRTQILSPWNLTESTGLAGRTTIAKINAIICAQTLGCPVFTQATDLKSVHSDVPRIKNFLNQILGTNLNTNTQSMDLATIRAVSAFQTRYKDFILKPLGLSRATGLWYVSTMKQANEFMGCGGR